MTSRFWRWSAGSILMLAAMSVTADDIRGANELLCSSMEVTACGDDGECIGVFPEDLNIPNFIRIDIKKRKLSTTEASGEDRETIADTLKRIDGRLILQGYENGRAFSLVIHEETGAATFAGAAVFRSVTVFGACTPL